MRFPALNSSSTRRSFYLCAAGAVLLLFLDCTSAAAQAKDTLYFLNKTLVVGKLRSVRLGYFEFDADGMGIVRIKNSKISSMHAQSRNFRVETTGDSVMNGGFTRSSRPGWTIFHAAEKSIDLPIEEIATLGYYGQSLRTRLDGNVGAGFNYTKSSQIGRFNLNARIRYSSTKTLLVLEGDLITTYDSATVERERENLKLSYYYLFPSVWTAGGYANYQRNIELGLDRRWQEVVGVGRKFSPSSGQQGVVMAGLAINQEQNLERNRTEGMEVLLQVNYNLFSFEQPNGSINIMQTAYASITDQGRYRSDGNINLSLEIVKDLLLTFQFYHNYDSKSPNTGAPNVDWGTVAGLTFKFQ
jgi:hypothetical protein